METGWTYIPLATFAVFVPVHPVLTVLVHVRWYAADNVPAQNALLPAIPVTPTFKPWLVEVEVDRLMAKD
jgi:hypothetical protein